MRTRARVLALACVCAALLAVAPNHHAVAAPEDVVYITNTGDRFHRDGCRFLKDSKVKSTRKQAEAQGKKACAVCKP